MTDAPKEPEELDAPKEPKELDAPEEPKEPEELDAPEELDVPEELYVPEKLGYRPLTLEMVRHHFKKYGMSKPIRYMSDQVLEDGGKIIFSDLYRHADDIGELEGQFFPDGSLYCDQVRKDNWLIKDQSLPILGDKVTFFLGGNDKFEYEDEIMENTLIEVLPCGQITQPNDCFYFVKAKDWDNLIPV